MSDAKPRASIKLPDDFLFGQVRPHHEEIARQHRPRRLVHSPHLLEIGSVTASTPSSGPTTRRRQPRYPFHFLPATTFWN